MSKSRRPKTKRSVPMRVPTIVPRMIENLSQEEIADIIAPPEAEAEMMRAVRERFDRAIMDSVQQSSRAIDPDGLSGFNIDHIVGVGETIQHVARNMGVSARALGRAVQQIGTAQPRQIQMLPVPDGVPTYRDVIEHQRRQIQDAIQDAMRLPPEMLTAPPPPAKPVQPGAPTIGKRKLNLGDD